MDDFLNVLNRLSHIRAPWSRTGADAEPELPAAFAEAEDFDEALKALADSAPPTRT